MTPLTDFILLLFAVCVITFAAVVDVITFFNAFIADITDIHHVLLL